MSKKLQCKICGKEHNGCPTCISQKLFTWKNIACCEEHGNMYIVFVDYERKNITKQEAKIKIEKIINNFGMPNFTDDNKKIFDEIMTDDILQEIESKPVKKARQPKTK